MVKTTGSEGREFYGRYIGKDVYIRYAQEPGESKDFIQVRVVRLDEDSLFVTGAINADIPYDIINEIVDPETEEMPRAS